MANKFRYIKGGKTYFDYPDSTADTKYFARNASGDVEYVEYSRLANIPNVRCIERDDNGGAYAYGASPLSYRDVIVNDGPVGYWRLGEPSGTSAVDTIGSNTGTTQATVTPGVGGCLSDNTAYLFDGTQGKVAFSNPALTTAFSLEAWVYILGAGTVGTTDYCCVFGIDATHRFLMRNTTQEILVQMGGGNVSAPAGSFAMEQWTHVVYTRSGNSQNLYANGVNVATLSQSGASFNGAFFLGSYLSTSANYSYYGRMDEVAIYNKELTPAQVLTHYVSRPNPTNAGLNATDLYSTNAPAPLTISTPDSTGEVVEPCVEHITGGWNGYPWWGLITGYHGSNPLVENPSIYHSTDGLSFTPMAGAPFPLDGAPAGGGNNADPELRLGPDNHLHAFYIRFNNPAGFTGVYHMDSADGVTWTGPTKILESSSATEQVTGPVLLWDPDNNRWVMWYVDAHNTAAPYPIKRRTCSGTDPTGTWSAATTCTLSGLPSGKSPWEAHIEYYGDQLHMVTTMATNGTGGGGTTLHFGVSNDHGFTWTFNPDPLISPQTTGWDAGQVYRGDFGPIPDTSPGFYGLWYSGKSTGSGIWRWGYTTIYRR